MSIVFSNCERDLRQTGRIQDYGCLLILGKTDRRFLAVSENAPEFGLNVTVGDPASNLPDEISELVFKCEESIGLMVGLWNRLCVSIESTSVGLQVEIEPQHRGSQRPPLMRRSPLFREALDGFLTTMGKIGNAERMLLYKFHEDFSGEVIAEIYHGDGDRYLGLRYPSTDIPKVARDLYLETPIRYIQDATSGPVDVSTDLPELDLGLSVLREVSPFHLSYLKNMGVRSAVSIPIVRDDKLWGLFSLHSGEPGRVDRYARLSLVSLASDFRQRLIQEDSAATMKFLDQIRPLFASALAGETSDCGKLMTSLAADSLMVMTDGQWQYFGAAHPAAEMEALANEVRSSQPDGVIHSSCLTNVLPALDHLTDVAAGFLSIHDSRSNRQVLFLRNELIQEVTWGSKVEQYPGELHPNNSFGRWQETVRGKSAPWTTLHLAAGKAFYAAMGNL